MRLRVATLVALASCGSRWNVVPQKVAVENIRGHVLADLRAKLPDLALGEPTCPERIDLSGPEPHSCTVSIDGRPFL